MRKFDQYHSSHRRLIRRIFQLFTFLALVPPMAMGQTNLALKLAGNPGDFIQIPASTSLRFSTNITVEAWVNVPGFFGSDARLPFTAVAKRRPDGGTGFRFGLGSPTFVFEIVGASGKSLRAATQPPFAFGQWVHVAGTYDGRFARIYVNGSQAGSQEGDLILEDSDFPLLIGKEGLAELEKQWVGQIDEVRVWNRSLTREEIQRQMLRRLSGVENGLAGYWTFDRRTGDDLSRNGNHGLMRGSPQFVPIPKPESPLLLPGRFQPNGSLEVLAEIQSGFDLMIEASSDLQTWTRGYYRIQPQDKTTLIYSEYLPPQATQRYYRAIVLGPPL